MQNTQQVCTRASLVFGSVVSEGQTGTTLEARECAPQEHTFGCGYKCCRPVEVRKYNHSPLHAHITQR